MTATPTSSSPLDPFALAARVGQRIRQEVVLAHFLGKMAVDRGTREAREHLTGALAPSHGVAPGPEVAPVDVVDARVAEAATSSAIAPSAADLALSDYDHLPSAHIVAKLESLDQRERDAIEAYEQAGRHRRTILAKLARLREAEAT